MKFVDIIFKSRYHIYIFILFETIILIGLAPKAMYNLFLFLFFSNYWQNQFDTINSNIHDITNIGYTYFLLAIVIKLFRGVKNNG